MTKCPKSESLCSLLAENATCLYHSQAVVARGPLNTDCNVSHALRDTR
jgi:hypothetical protein